MRRAGVLAVLFGIIGLFCAAAVGGVEAFAGSSSVERAGDPQAPALGAWSVSGGRPLEVASPSSVDESGILPVRIVAPGHTRVTVRWLGKAYALKLVDGRGGTLLPAPAERSKSGLRTLIVQAGGTEVRHIVAVRAVRWPVQKLKVAPKYVNPPKSVSRRIASERKRTAEALSKAQASRLWTRGFVQPLKHMTTTNAFGGKRFFNGQLRSRHQGLDLRGATGTPVRAAASGRVLLAEEQYYSGNMIYVDHGDGLLTLYCHLSRLDVRPGDRVQAGQVLGLMGATGRVTGPHLHFGVRLRGQMVNPVALFAMSEALLSAPDRNMGRSAH